VTAPSEMYGTAKQLWVYDLASCSWDRGPMLSDRGGDGEEQYRLDSWVVDLDSDGARDIVQRQKNWGEDYDGKPFEAGKRRLYFWSYGHFAETLSREDARRDAAFDFSVR